MESGKMDRRAILRAMGVGAMGAVFPAWEITVLGAVQDRIMVNVGNNYEPGQWYYDPVGIYIQKGQTVRWQSKKWGPTVTAFHPENDNHEFRIPENAKPFDSGLIGDSYKNTFDWTFDVEGTYDYYSRNHEMLGMVGRIVVGTPGGPAEKYPPGYGAREGRAPVLPAQAKLLAAIPSAEIVAKKKIPYPLNLLVIPYPYGER